MEKLEKREMWRVTETLLQDQVDVIFNEKGHAICYYDRRQEDFFKASSDMHIFETKEQSDEWLEEYKTELKGRMLECRRFIDLMERLEPSDDFDFRREEYLGIVSRMLDAGEEREEYHEQIISILGNAAKRRILTIAGTSFLLDAVKDIRWHDNQSATVITDDVSVTSVNGAEYNALMCLFGDKDPVQIDLEPQ